MSLVHYEIVGTVARITLDRPPVNALSGELIADIDEAVTQAQSDDVRAVVITGTKHFAAGATLRGSLMPSIRIATSR